MNRYSTIILSICLTLLMPGAIYASTPDFSSIRDVKEKKKAFFTYMNDYAKKANEEVLSSREKLITLSKVSSPTKNQAIFVNRQAEKYKLKCESYSNCIKKLLINVDEIPASLLLAQSANESAWGTSRFAKKGNNYFGQWCFTKGCGIIPSQRDKGKVHEVMAFTSAYDSVKAYIYNLNTSYNYTKLREIRSSLRKNNKPISGIALAKGLINYSERGNAYINEITNMIKYNKLSMYDRRHIA